MNIYCTLALKALDTGVILFIGTQHSASATQHCKSSRHEYGKKAYTLKYVLEFHSKYWMRSSISTFYDVYNFIIYHLKVTVIFWPRS